MKEYYKFTALYTNEIERWIMCETWAEVIEQINVLFEQLPHLAQDGVELERMAVTRHTMTEREYHELGATFSWWGVAK